MIRRAALVLALVAGGTAQAQDVMRVTYSWVEVEAGTNIPVASPNSVLEPGEGARIQMTLEALHNGTDAIGQTTNYPGGGSVHPGAGPIRSIAGFVYDMVGTSGDVSGGWNSRAISPLLPAGAYCGVILQGGARVHSIGGGQFLPPGSTADGTNPVVNAWRGVWNPVSYVARTVNFKAEPADTVPVGQHNAIYVQCGSGFVDPNDPSTEFAVYWATYLAADFGAGVNIPVGPGPSMGGSCYANCDQSSAAPVLNAADFQCYLNKFAIGDPYANCDQSTTPPVLNVNDFQCFMNQFMQGCP